MKIGLKIGLNNRVEKAGSKNWDEDLGWKSGSKSGVEKLYLIWFAMVEFHMLWFDMVRDDLIWPRAVDRARRWPVALVTSFSCSNRDVIVRSIGFLQPPHPKKRFFCKKQFFSNAFLHARGRWCPVLCEQDLGGTTGRAREKKGRWGTRRQKEEEESQEPRPPLKF